MDSTLFTAALLRTSATGFAAMAASRTVERTGEDGAALEAWQAHFRTLLLELASAVDDGSAKQFAAKVDWTREAFIARKLPTESLRTALEELGAVLEESLPGAAWEPLAGFMEAARGALDNGASTGTSTGTSKSASVGPLDELVDDYVARILQGDSPGAIALVIEAIRDDRLSVADALDGVLTRALQEFGRMWHADIVTVAEEHFATQTSGRLLEQIMVSAPKPPPGDRTVMLTMVEGDAHDLGLRIVAAFFELDGWRTICLGANTPSVDLSLASERFDVDLVVVGATLNTQRAAVAQTIDVLRRSRPDLKIIVGGPAFSELGQPRTSVGADGCVLAPKDAVQLGRELLAEG